MSVYVTSLVWKFSKSSGSTLLVALAIADFADDEGRAYPSVSTLATKARVSERTAQYALTELVGLSELAIERGTGPRGCNTYHILVEALRGAQDRGAKDAGGADSAGVQNTAQGGATHCTRTINRTVIKKKEESAHANAATFDQMTGRIVGIPDEILAKWVMSFQGLNVQAEITRAECWLVANPKKAKKDYIRFLNNWLSSAHKDLRSNPRSARVSAPTRTQHREAFASLLHGAPNNQAAPGHFHGGNDVVDVVATEVH